MFHSVRLLRLLSAAFLLLGGAPASREALAASPEEELKARHQALIAAYNRRDVKALRTYYAREFRYEELRGAKIPLDDYMSGFEQMFKALPKPGKDKATLEKIKIQGDTATAVESRRVQGVTGKVSGPARTAHTWKKLDGVWRLALEKEMKE